MLDFNGTNGKNPTGHLISDGTYLYGTTGFGGTNNIGTVFKIKLIDNSYTKLLDFNDTNGAYPGSLFSDGTFLYGTAGFGGVNNDGVLFSIAISDSRYTKLLDFDGISNGSGAA